MDLNQLYFDHQLLLIRARLAASFGIRDAHEAKASQIALRIGRMQRRLGAAAAQTWERLSVTGDHAVSAPQRHRQDYAGPAVNLKPAQ